MNSPAGSALRGGRDEGSRSAALPPSSSSVSGYEHSEKAVLILRTASNVLSLQGEDRRLGQPSLPPALSPGCLFSRHRLILGKATRLHSHSEIFLRMAEGWAGL